jgi:hypothetical protein
MLFKETIAIYYENHLKHADALSVENEILTLKQAAHLQERVSKCHKWK